MVHQDVPRALVDDAVSRQRRRGATNVEAG